MTSEIERIRSALHGRRLSPLAAQLGVPMPTLEAFVSNGARLAPALLAALAKVLESSPPAPSKNIPARKPDMRLAARALKCTAVLDATGLRDPGSNSSRVMLEIVVDGKVFGADVAAKSVRKCKAMIVEHGVDNVALLIQGKLEGNAIVEAGLVAQPRNTLKATAAPVPDSP